MSWECSHVVYVGYEGYTQTCDHENEDASEVCEKCGQPRVYFCSGHYKSWTNGGECTICAEIRELKNRAESAESELAAMRQRAQELEKENEFHSYELAARSEECDFHISQHNAALARAERAEAALEDIKTTIEDKLDEHPHGDDHVNCFLENLKMMADAVLSSPPADASKMGGEREPADTATQWSEPGTLMIDRVTGETIFVPKASERERRLVEAMKGLVAILSMPIPVDPTLWWSTLSDHVVIARAILADMEQKS